MSLEAAFLADILENPDDDVPRLVYADWLAENGDPDRGEFIRVQIELARLPSGDPALAVLRERESALLRHHHGRWLRGLETQNVIFGRFVRGFVEGITIHAANFFEYAEKLYALAPIRDVMLDDASPVLTRLARRPALFRPLRTLRLGKPLDDVVLPVAPLLELLCAPELAGLRTLDLQGCYLGRSFVPRWDLARAVPGLRELGLSLNELGDAALEVILAGLAPRPIEVLDLQGNQITDMGALALARWENGAHLRWLRLEGNTAIHEAGVAAILASSYLRKLERLGISEMGLRIRGLMAERFRAGGTAIDRADAIIIMGGPDLPVFRLRLGGAFPQQRVPTMNGTWHRTDIAGKPADLYELPGNARPRFGVLSLHPASQETLAGNATFTRLFDELGLACICPHAGESWWTDRHCAAFDPAVSAQRLLLDHVLPFFRTRWGLAPPGVAALGIGMGGQGALRLGFEHPALFPVVAGISPAVEYQTLYGRGTPLDGMYDSKEQARQDTVLLRINPHQYPPHIWFAIDPADADWFRGNDRLHEKLSALGIAHTADLATRAGGHSWDYFNAMAGPAVRFLVAGLEQQSRRLL